MGMLGFLLLVSAGAFGFQLYCLYVLYNDKKNKPGDE